jgi:hypothetical protein
MRRLPLAATLLAATLAGPAFAQPADRLAALEARMQALEAESARLKAEAEAAQAALAEARTEIEALKQAQAAPGQEVAAAEAPAPEAVAEAGSADASASGNANAFNPAISVVLNGELASHSLDPQLYYRDGFPLVGEGAPSARGMSLGESEVTLSANIDDKFYGQLTVALDSEDTVGVEEAFIDTTSLPNGLALRAGRFFSNIGYLNSHHAHTDNFVDRPLAYQALLGNQYGDDGVQLRWVAPTDTYLEFGTELLRGESLPLVGAARGGIGVRTLFMHAGGSVGDESEWLAGLSAVDARSDGGQGGFDGRTRIYIADATWKWAPQGNFKDGGISVRGEYLVEDRDGRYYYPDDPGFWFDWDGRRHGAYVEAVYRINRRWNTGIRYDRLWTEHNIHNPFSTPFDPQRYSLMATWMNSEFSLLRLQYAHDHPNEDDTDQSVTLQYQVNFGAHGAHKF